VTKRLVKEVSEDCVKVIVDYGMAPKKKGIDTGKFIRIYKGVAYNENPNNNMGLKLCLEGISL
jgi:hypothetical protein